jgi:hypothetical protein
MVMSSRAYRHFRCLAYTLPLLAWSSSLSFAQPVLDLALSDAQLVSVKGCEILKVNFNIRIRYAHHFPLDNGNDLRISINPVDKDQLIALQSPRREAARAPVSKIVGIKAIDFETQQAAGPVLRIQFDHPVFYRVAQSADVQSIIIAISGNKPSPTCQPEFPANGPGSQAAVVVPHDRSAAAAPAPDRPKERPLGKISDADLKIVAAAMDEARAALKKHNFNGAIALLTKALNYPENEYSAEAQELLGLARQKNGQLAAAKAEYEDYLRRYPSGEGNERVKQRLDGIVTATGEPFEKLRTVPDQPGGKPDSGKFWRSDDTSWTFSGSASAFYIRDDSFRVARDPSVALDPTADADAHQVHQNEVLSSLDLFATWNNDATKGKIRFSGTEEHGFDSSTTDRFGVAALFAEVSIKDWDVLARVGRQTRNTDGVLGRFDGALVSWQAAPFAKVNLVAGSPVLSRYDDPFKDQRYFYGASVDFAPILGGLETSLYAIEQRDRWLLDRQAVGTELRYFDQTKSGFATVDYDVHFQQLNAAIFSGSWTLLDKSTIYGGADYRKTPYLSTWNALLNQPFATLYEMQRLQSLDQLQQLAVSQTPTYKSAMIGYSRPLNDHFQISADATVANLTQPIILSAVDPGLPNLPAGNEYYYSTQLMANNLLKDGDMYVTALRYSQLLDSNMYVVDFNTRYPMTKELFLSPRLRLGYRDGRGVDLKEYTALPSMLVDYYWSKELSFEAEVGLQRTWSEQAGIKDNTAELFVNFGVRYDFYADDTTKNADKRNCSTPVAAALCRYNNSADKGNCASPPPGCR